MSEAETAYFGMNEDEVWRVQTEAWKIVEDILDTFAAKNVNDKIAVYVANFLLWRVAEIIVHEIRDKDQLMRFLKMLNESHSIYCQDILTHWELSPQNY